MAANKKQILWELAAEKARQVVEYPQHFMQLLDSAAANYKYTFMEQLLIYAQKPTATACATMKTWNRLGRWVNKNATGIALLPQNNASPLQYVFDVSDTNSFYGHSVQIWKMEDQYLDAALESLRSAYGLDSAAPVFSSMVLSTASALADERFNDYLPEFLAAAQGSGLKHIHIAPETAFRELLEKAVSYMVLSRCGQNPAALFLPEDFKFITAFDTAAILASIGTAASDLSENILRVIEGSVKKSIKQERENLNEIKNTEYNEPENKAGRSIQHGFDLHETRGLSDPGSGSGAGENREIRNVTGDISPAAPSNAVHAAILVRTVEEAPGGNRPAGQRDAGSNDERNGSTAGRDGTSEGNRSDEVGRNDEQYPERSGGNHSPRPDLQLSLPSVADQQREIEDAEPSDDDFSITQEDIDTVLTRGSGFAAGKFRIFEQFLKQESHEDNAKMLKNEYGIGGTYPAIDAKKIDLTCNGKGIQLASGRPMAPADKITLSWSKVEKRIGELIDADRYLSAADKKEYLSYVAAEIDRIARITISNDFKSIVNQYNGLETQLGNTHKCFNMYYVSGCCTSFSTGDKKMYAREGSGEFILPLMRSTMETIIEDDTPLTDLAKTMLERLNGDIAMKLEPSYDEQNPPPQPIKEYHFDVGDIVRIGIQEYDIVSFDEKEVRLYDPQFPLLNKIYSYDKFIQKLSGNPLNDKLLRVVEPAAAEIDWAVKENSTETAVSTEREFEVTIGQVIEVDGRQFVIEEINEDSGEVSMRDLTFGAATGFPISRNEKIKTVCKWVQDKKASILPPSTLHKGEKKHSPTLHPEVSQAARHNFHITDDGLGVGTPSERIAHNVAAIRLLKTLERDNRFATPEEQSVLSEYVGWGGLADCFDERHSRYGELKDLLAPDEYEAARSSTLTSFYTPPVIVRSIYQALENMNFKVGNILEPSCGTGNFFGMLPGSMEGSKLYGVELNSISGRIAQQLYQSSNIAVQGFENTDLPDSFFDAAIGNVPFGQFKVLDKRYDKYNFLIHDYFFARALDKVRPGGVIAFITSKGTMDKQNPNVRKYIAQRADLLGAIRLPNDTFKAAAGTEVTSDIIFLQKRDRLTDRMPEWINIGEAGHILHMNQYFIDHPEMILGDMQMISGPHGPESACLPAEGKNLGTQLQAAIENIHAEINPMEITDLPVNETEQTIPADPDVRNFSFALSDGKLYYRENSCMKLVTESAPVMERIKSLIKVRDSARQLIKFQTEDYSDAEIQAAQEELNAVYDCFSKKYGIINSRGNISAFRADSSFCLLSSLEVLDEEGEYVSKADIFSKRTIRPHIAVTSVDTASEALAISLSEKAKVDMAYMSQLTGKTEEALADDLKGVIFHDFGEADGGQASVAKSFFNLSKFSYVTADEYLSGNVRNKLCMARAMYEAAPDNLKEQVATNVYALESVQPTDLSASDISVRLGATWIPSDVIEDFIYELFDTPRYAQWSIHVHFMPYTGEWNIEGKSYDRSNVKSDSTYGTARINGYKIVEQTLNLRDVQIYDYAENDGKKAPILNKKETAIAQGKQEQIKQAFSDWIWKDPERRQRLCQIYNEKFNSNRPREYNGGHLSLAGINPEIQLRPHQLNAIARGIYGGNELLGHVVGAGKTFTMVSIAQESKRLGLCHKTMIAVPNHLTEQWASEYLQLYPSANILVATARDFEAKNRKRFCGRIATGDYDAIIIGHSQLEKIPMSLDRQRYILEQEKAQIINGIAEVKANRGDNFSVKQLERSKKSIETKLAKLNDQSRKDDLVTFEELGIDKLMVDEAHYFKNLAAFTKMRNVAGISQTEAQKSSDLYMKCRYLDEITAGHGVVFATGTPISNTMVEMYTMQKYLQYGTLKRNDLLNFDAWASTFGETVTAIELAPEGTGYRAKTRFAKFYNLPELLAMFKEVADIQTADMLNLPVPEAHYHSIVLQPSDLQRKMVGDLSKRAERVRNKMVNSSEDNMLVITNDGRKLALDQRLINPMLPDSSTGKTAACAQNVFEIWQQTAEQRSAQMVFCDLSTSHGDGKFNVYDDLRDKLLARGIPAKEIAYIHTADSEAKKKDLFGKVRSGQIRILIGSTQKMGAGTNVQERLKALHHLDCPWRPADLQQREGRIIRQGNLNPDVDIYTYVTENTFDSYLYQLVESKQKFIGQIMTSKNPVRSAEDVDDQALSYAEIKALCAGNPEIKEKMDLDVAVQKLKLLRASHLSQQYALEDKITKDFPYRIAALEQRVVGYKADTAFLPAHTRCNADGFSPMKIRGKLYTDKKAAGVAILEECKSMVSRDAVLLGEYRGFSMELSFDIFNRVYNITLQNELRHTVPLGTDIFGNIQRLDNALDGMQDSLKNTENQLSNAKNQMETAKIEVKKPFPQEEELRIKMSRLDELNITLNLDKAESEDVTEEELEVSEDAVDHGSIRSHLSEAITEATKRNGERHTDARSLEQER